MTTYNAGKVACHSRRLSGLSKIGVETYSQMNRLNCLVSGRLHAAHTCWLLLRVCYFFALFPFVTRRETDRSNLRHPCVVPNGGSDQGLFETQVYPSAGG